MTDFIDASTGEVLPGTEDNIIVAFALYQHEAARQEHWTVHNHLTKPWGVGIKERLAESGGMSAWKRAIQKASVSDWLCGRIIGKKSETRFKMTLKFMLQPVSFVSILDGFYDNRKPEPSRLVLPTLSTPAQKPQPVFKHDLETPEERISFTITRLRAAGQYARANTWEEELAKMQKRPPVLVPAPEVAFTSGAAQPQQRSGSAYPPSPARQPPQGPVSEPEWEMVPE